MLNKGLVESVNGELRVRVLENNGEKDKAGSSVSSDLPSTLFIYIKGLDGQYKDGDAVIVGYEKKTYLAQSCWEDFCPQIAEKMWVWCPTS